MKLLLKKVGQKNLDYWEIEDEDSGISGEFHEDETLGDILEMLKEQKQQTGRSAFKENAGRLTE